MKRRKTPCERALPVFVAARKRALALRAGTDIVCSTQRALIVALEQAIREVENADAENAALETP